MAKEPLHPQARRIRTIIWSLPLMVGCGYVLYRRMVLGEEQRKFATDISKPKLGISAQPQREGEIKPSDN